MAEQTREIAPQLNAMPLQEWVTTEGGRLKAEFIVAIKDDLSALPVLPSGPGELMDAEVYRTQQGPTLARLSKLKKLRDEWFGPAAKLADQIHTAILAVKNDAFAVVDIYAREWNAAVAAFDADQAKKRKEAEEAAALARKDQVNDLGRRIMRAKATVSDIKAAIVGMGYAPAGSLAFDSVETLRDWMDVNQDCEEFEVIVAAYQEKQERERMVREAKASGDAETAAALEELPEPVVEAPVVQRAPVAPPPPPPPPEVKAEGVSTRKTYVAEVRDIKKLIAAIAEGKVALEAVAPVPKFLDWKARDVRKDGEEFLPGVFCVEQKTTLAGRSFR